MRGVPEIESEPKDQGGYAITLTAREKFKLLARKRNCSASQLLENIARQRYFLISLAEIDVLKEYLSDKGLRLLEDLIRNQNEEINEDKASENVNIPLIQRQ